MDLWKKSIQTQFWCTRRKTTTTTPSSSSIGQWKNNNISGNNITNKIACVLNLPCICFNFIHFLIFSWLPAVLMPRYRCINQNRNGLHDRPKIDQICKNSTIFLQTVLLPHSPFFSLYRLFYMHAYIFNHTSNPFFYFFYLLVCMNSHLTSLILRE